MPGSYFFPLTSYRPTVTRATLLQLLAHPTALNGADVRALEQLAEAFPYCQTAHLLLAKAAHDQGSMLAGQRLRRAATYAADRSQLRQLIELPVLAAAPVALVAAETNVAVPAPFPTPAFVADEVGPAALAETYKAERQTVAPLEDKPGQVMGQVEPTAVLPEAEASAATELPGPVAALEVESPAAPKLTEPVAALEAELLTAAELSESVTGHQVELPAATALPEPDSLPEPQPEVATATELPASTSLPEAELPTAAEQPELPPLLAAEVPAEKVAAAKEAPEPEEELPVQAPPIRPPAGAAAARFEFGLAEQEPAEITAYRLPELAEIIAPTDKTAAPVTPQLPVFRGLKEVSYAPEEGSRLGFCLVATAGAELLPGTSLPPAGEFFAPDALLLAHLATHQRASEPKPNTISLIDSFLQRAPATTRRRQPPSLTAPEPEAQADLSVRSTRAESDLASESLAKILVRQGKTDRAIAVYERLMVKHPEKMAYFAAQIESLRPSA
ncbi:hypothetical protein QMK33_09640 [Hymenobacter sp. H14-R3]|uniref:hypothetical protein n=1 Tax=Hymenobacter sp. H14-R3 TaxID=3046308 RepID=UPI0024BB3F4B|nr:hypothetical protein [Hymenobacter sp. H14-R3]MDJ0365416.1 hypothetical protein [Hymenobacter sp. H14-R3]